VKAALKPVPDARCTVHFRGLACNPAFSPARQCRQYAIYAFNGIEFAGNGERKAQGARLKAF